MHPRTKQAVAAAVAGALAAPAIVAARRTPGHPLFARFYSVLARLAEHGELGRRRAALAGEARGLVLELGSGTGECFRLYPSAVRGVVAAEPDPTMLRIASRRARRATVPVRPVRASGEALPFREGTFDTAVAMLVLCSVEDHQGVLAELRRVLRPGGRLLFLEHVRAEDERLARWQDRLEHLWGRVAGGCHPNRPSLDAIRAAGFEPEAVEAFDLRAGIPIVHPHVQGSAVRP